MVTFLRSDQGLTLLCAGLVLFAVLAGILAFRHRATVLRVATLNMVHQRALDELTMEIQDLITAKTTAEIRLAETDKRLAEERVEKLAALTVCDRAREDHHVAERRLAEAAEKVRSAEDRLADWEVAKKQGIDAAKAATSEIAAQVSSKLIDDHKAETKAAREDTEKRVRETTEKVTGRFSEMTKILVALDKDVGDTRATMDTVWRAISSPGGAGQFAEIGLENTLKSFGLEKGRDFVVQQQVEGKRLRPDVMVFLPGERVLVIDSKASKFLLDLASADGEAAEAEALANLAKTMNTHLRALADKNYAGAVRESYRASGHNAEIKYINTVMYLPNEAAIHKLELADPHFMRKAAKLRITASGPSGLAGLIGFARVEIDVQRQAENHERIIHGTRLLLDSLGIMLEEAERVGKGVKSASEHFDKMAKSINGRLLPRVRTLMGYGIRPDRHKGIPTHITRFQVTELDSSTVIDGEVEAVVDVPRLSGEGPEPDGTKE